MKHFKLYEEFGNDRTGNLTKQQIAFVNGVTNDEWEVNASGRVDVKGSVYVRRKKGSGTLEKLPVSFGFIDGSFDLENCVNLKTLEGCPIEVEIFNCKYCEKLKSLEHAPKIVHGDFNCSYSNSLKDLKGAPERVGGSFLCYMCKGLESLEGAPSHVRSGFTCGDCTSLKSLDYLPKEILGTLKFYGCNKIPMDQKNLVKNVELFNAWRSSKMNISDFIKKRPGQMKGVKFGI